jgi:HAMP domain-containing protein
MFARLKLAPKFTLILLLIFVIGSATGGLVLSKVLQHRVETQVQSEGVMLMETMRAVQRYTDEEIRPLLEVHETPDVFWPQAIPAYSSTQLFQRLRAAGEQLEGFDYQYKLAVLNPTNPNDLANGFETTVIDAFAQEAAGLSEISPAFLAQGKSGYTEIPEQGLMFYSALPIVIQNPSCLECHSTPEAAPPAMLAQYGRDNGFNWNLNEVLGTQIVYVPAQGVFSAARQAFASVMGVFFLVFAIALIGLNYWLKPLVVKPVQSLAKISEKLANDDIQSPADLDQAETRKLQQVVTRQDELGQLGQVFQRMVNEVIARQQRLRQQIRDLKIEIDESRKTKEVEQIVETDYFKDLQAKAKKFRDRDANPDTEG